MLFTININHDEGKEGDLKKLYQDKTSVSKTQLKLNKKYAIIKNIQGV